MGVGQAMDGLSIGQVASSFGLRTSTVRYYEREGLIPKPARKSGRRVYGPDVRDHLLFVRLALDSGFHIAEVRALVKGMTPASKPGERWRSVAATKLKQLDREIESLKVKKRLLEALSKCQCPSLAHFARSQMTAKSPVSA